MESKTKHRILGVLVVAGLAVIAWPFLQGHEGGTEVTTIKEPAFPDQSAQSSPEAKQEAQPVAEMENSQTQSQVLASASTTNVTTTPEAATTAAPEAAATTAPDVRPTPTPESETTLGSEVVKSEPDDIIKNEHPAEPSKSAPAIAAPGEENATTEPAKKTSSTKKAKSTTVSKNTKHSSHRLSAKTSKKTLANKTVKNNHLFNIQDPSWVIQVGSFKNKTAALKVVNQLRASGYRAFIQQFASGDDSTRVFVGPENKQAHARQLAQDLNAKMHLQGIVISYQPLA